MVNKTTINCKKCKTAIAYIPGTYQMACDVMCISCGDKTPKKKKKRAKRSAATGYARCRRGLRPDIHPEYVFRSASEANLARVFEYLGFEWSFEESIFSFDRFDPSTGQGYKTPPYNYLMDFEVQKAPKRAQKKLGLDLPVGYYEMKGYMTPKDRNKMRRYKKNYPKAFAKTVMVISVKKDIEFCEKNGFKYVLYKDLVKTFEGIIPTWE